MNRQKIDDFLNSLSQCLLLTSWNSIDVDVNDRGLLLLHLECCNNIIKQYLEEKK